MYKYKLTPIYEIIPLKIKIVKEQLNVEGFADILSINLEYSYKLSRAKNRINDINSLDWEEVKKITNPYEFIHAFNPKSKYNDNKSVAQIKPLSRSFFKLIEIIHDFCSFLLQDLENPKHKEEISREPLVSSSELNSIVSVHIAEGPGGFIEAIRYIRKGCVKDHAFGITLVKYDKNQYKNIHVPGWQKSNKFLINNPEVYILNGADGTGDIYKTENINFLNNKVRLISIDGADIVTADGGFDFSIDYNYQEQSSCKLIFSQIICALKCQKQNGTFICKFFDCNLYFTVEMLYLLYTLYETVYIYKPYTSRITNSEKYIICKNFKGINIQFLDSLFDVLEKWNKYDGYTNNHIFEKIPIDFIEKIKQINIELIEYQIIYINIAIDIIKSKKKNDTKWYETNIDLQIKKAKEWCKKYNIPITCF